VTLAKYFCLRISVSAANHCVCAVYSSLIRGGGGLLLAPVGCFFLVRISFFSQHCGFCGVFFSPGGGGGGHFVATVVLYLLRTR